MIKNILIIISISMLALACSNNSNSVSGKPTTQNVPSVDHTKKQGSLALNSSQTVLFSVSSGGGSPSGSSTAISTITPQEDTTANDAKSGDQKEYSVLTRLYNTVWFQTEEEYDHGRVETESTFLFFNENSEIEEREIETGEPNESDYSKLAIVKDINLTTSQNNNDTTRDKNACVIKNMEIGENDTEFELYYLKDENTLYVIELSDKKYTNTSELESKAKEIINKIESGNAVQYNEDKYALSTI